MCGIFAILGSQESRAKTVERAAEAASKLSHRGPDWSGMNSFENDINGKHLSFAIAHERLQIIDPLGGEQPIVDKDGMCILSVNGEIYNYRKLMADPKLAPFLSGVLSKSDCEVIIPLWKHYTSSLASTNAAAATPDTLAITTDSTDEGRERDERVAAINVNNDLDGDFAYVLWDQNRLTYMIARDPIGVNPLYIGYSEKDGSIIVSSEIKAFSTEYVTDFREFPPGCVLTANSFMDPVNDTFDNWLNSHILPYYTPSWKSKTTNFLSDNEMQIQRRIRELLTQAVKKRLMSDVPIGFLLSGGLDSSLICSIAARLMGPDRPIKTFSIGLRGSPDLRAARKVAEYLKTDHYEFEFTPEQGMAALPNVIYYLETFDITTCRASTPMFLMARRIKALGIKVLLSGEGSDELFGGYLYFHKAPNKFELYEETVDKVLALSKYDCLRANKSMSAWGCEIRVPFLDRDFINYVMSIDPGYKMISKVHEKDVSPSFELTPLRVATPTTGLMQAARKFSEKTAASSMEKWILRQSFEGYLPHDILYRQKEQFSDGVGYNWIDSLKQLTETKITDKQLHDADSRFPDKTPKTKEAYYYRTIFSQRLTHPMASVIVPWSKSVACSTERALRWDKAWQTMDEPSGRAINVHCSTLKS